MWFLKCVENKMCWHCMKRRREIIQDIIVDLRFICWSCCHIYPKVKDPKRKHSVTNSADYYVTTVFNKVSILGPKLSLALEERSKAELPGGVSLVLNLMQRAIPSQDKEAIEQFSPRCSPERHSPLPEWLIFPLNRCQVWQDWRSWNKNVLCLFCWMLLGGWGMVCSMCARN